MLPDYDDSHTLRNSRRTSSLMAAAQDVLPPPVHFESHRISDDQLKACKNKKVKKFYEVILLFQWGKSVRGITKFFVHIASKLYDYEIRSS